MSYEKSSEAGGAENSSSATSSISTESVFKGPARYVCKAVRVGIKNPEVSRLMNRFELGCVRSPVPVFGSDSGVSMCCLDVRAGRSITSVSKGCIKPKALI